MEICVRRTVTGRQRRREIMDRYGDEAGLEAARAAGDLDAVEALADLAIFKESPEQLDRPFTMTTTTELDVPDLSKLTPTRIQILRERMLIGPTNVQDLTAHLARDPKNVSKDVACLEGFGLIRSYRRGKEKIVQATGDEVTILL